MKHVFDTKISKCLQIVYSCIRLPSTIAHANRLQLHTLGGSGNLWAQESPDRGESRLAVIVVRQCLFVRCALVGSLVATFHVVDEGSVDHLVATRRWIVAREVPVARVVGAGFVEVLNGLIDYLYFGVDVLRS